MPTSCSATNLISFLGCKERYQLCTEDETQCSPLTGLHNIRADPERFRDLNPNQKTIFDLLWKMVYFLQLSFQLSFIGHESLVANEYRWYDSPDAGISAHLPDNQWQTEVANWMNTTLAAMQRQAISYARPPEFDVGPGVSSLIHITAPETEVEKSFCQNMKGRSKAHNSFSVLSFFFIIVLGLVIIITDIVLAKLTASIQKHTGKGLYERLEWIETSAFQLQRIAAEGRGTGPWTSREMDVPRLAEYGHVFSLTGESLKGRWSRSDCYEMRGEGAKEESGNEMERIEMLNWRKSPSVRDDEEPLVVRP
jgi:hypothetical protein